METKAFSRKYYLDWLRVLGILAVLIYHSTRFFNNEEWIVKNPTWYPGLDGWNMFAVTWMMPLMFVISGASLFYSVGKGGTSKFFKDKILRLLIPLVVCSLTHASVQVYLERFTHGQFTGSYFQFLPHYFQGIYDGDDPTRGNFAVTGMHLWYLFWLFIFTIFLYPLFRWLRGRGQSFLNRLGNLFSMPGAVYALMLPTLLLLVFVDPNSPIFDEAEAGWPVIVYLWLIISGFIVISNERLLESIQRLRWVSLVVAIISMGVDAFLLITTGDPVFGTGLFALIVSLRVLMSWSLILTLIGFGMQHLKASTPFLTYANEAVLPFYILHQTILLAVGFFIVQWAIPDLVKWLVILLFSFGLIMFFYEYLVRRFNLMRFLFGMKSLPQRPTRQAIKPKLEEAGRIR